ncbi:helix-turn-helix domain-containing protein [Marinicrinis lubricantis]|uniref:Helix-turn-helix domain-containing protein n=1 Tax=Marinicrinis lubricantis TaxID=2086470 RepID=A0ABW1IPT2_9BACL
MSTVEIIQRVIDFIEDRLDEQLSLDQIAQAAAMSVPNLYRIFYAMTGHPIKEYIRKRRISEAACLLRHTGLSSKEIGFQCGFETYQTFIKTFKRTTGLTPGLYRQTEIIYYFERMNLSERETYLEEREISERYPDVKVIRLAPQMGVSYVHISAQEEGIEEQALRAFQTLLHESQIDIRKMRLFGWNVDKEENQSLFGYQLAAVAQEPFDFTIDHSELRPITLPGGTYAVTWTPFDTDKAIVKAWNRLLSEWLPRSIFELGERGFLEEYQQYSGRVARLKLYLPVQQSHEKEGITLLDRAPLKVMSFRAEGERSEVIADEAAAQWLTRNGFVGDQRLQVFMHCSYGHSSDKSSTYEICITVPEGYPPSQEEEALVSMMEGGLYACLTTRAYGSMTGVLEQIYRWLGASDEYKADDERSWYAHYIPHESSQNWAGTDLERFVRVSCCVPIVLRNASKEERS